MGWVARLGCGLALVGCGQGAKDTSPFSIASSTDTAGSGSEDTREGDTQETWVADTIETADTAETAVTDTAGDTGETGDSGDAWVEPDLAGCTMTLVTGWFPSGLYEELSILVYAYDERAELSSYESVDPDGDPTDEFRVTYVRDADGLILESQTDRGKDGVVDEIQVYTYGKDGNLSVVSRDDGVDGTIDQVYTYTWIADELVEYTSSGSSTFRYTYAYNADGNEVLREYDSGDDGVVDTVYETTWFDADREERLFTSYPSRPEINSTRDYVWDGGWLLEEWVTYLKDDDDDRLVTYSYDGSWLVRSYEVFVVPDPDVPNAQQDYTYDCP